MPTATLTRTQASGRTQPVPASGESRTDDALLRAIASAKDREAFDELHRRYVDPCYNLALNIAGHRETAEEAVQDAMLRIWRFAGGFKPGGNARGWIMQTLAHSCIALLKKNAGERKREQEAATEPALAPPPPEGVAHDELLLALRAAVARLPETERRIVALYFGAELSQAEIGKELSISQRNVSGRLNRALESLGHDLAQDGFAASAPLLGSGLCAEALTTGHVSPPGLSAAIRTHMLENAAQQSDRIAAHASGGLAPALLALAAASAIGASAYAWLNLEPDAPPPAKTAAAVPDVPDAPDEISQPAVPAPAHLHRRWTFEKGIPDGLQLISGEWQWNAPADRRAGFASTDWEAWVALPVHAPARPMHIRIVFNRLTKKGTQGEYGINWIHGRTLPQRTVYKIPTMPKFKENGMFIDVYLFDRFAVSCCDGHVNSMVEYENPFPTDVLVFSLANIGISHLMLDEIGEDEIPKAARTAVETRHERRRVVRPESTLDEPFK